MHSPVSRLSSDEKLSPPPSFKLPIPARVSHTVLLFHFLTLLEKTDNSLFFLFQNEVMIQIFDPVRYCLHIHTRWCCRTTAEPLAQEKSSSMWLYFLHRQEIKSRMRTCLLCVVSIHSKVWKVFYIENCPVAMPILMWIIVVTIIVWRMNNGFILMTGQ